MTQDIEQNLKNLGIELPTAPSPAANYVPFVVVGNFLYVSGQISQNKNGLIIGKLGENERQIGWFVKLILLFSLYCHQKELKMISAF